ncbi:MAG: hypothetical protein IIU39_07205 [Ruminococcus sp.]|nr:hypothetical protein [Ruminococcus sp.]
MKKILTTILKKTSGVLNLFFNLVSKHKFITSLILCAVTSFIYIALNGFMVVSPNDDYCAFKTIYGGNIAIPCIGFFYSSLCAAIQPVFSPLNVYMCLQELICFMSMAAINYIFIAKLGAKKGLLFNIAMDSVIFSFVVSSILFTFTSVTASSAGFLCVMYGALYERRKGFKILQIAGGVLLVFSGVQLRFPPFEICCAVGFVFVFSVLLSAVFKSRKKLGLKAAVLSVFKKYLVTGVLLVAVVVSAFGLNALSEAMKYTDSAYAELKDYNEATAAINDVSILSGNIKREELDEIGLKTHYDLRTFRTWYIDDDVFTLDTLHKLAELYQKDNAVKKGFIENMISPFINTAVEFFYSGKFIIYFLALIILVFGSIFTLIFKPWLKGIILRFGIIVFLWSFYILTSDVLSHKCGIVLLLIAVSLYIAVRYNGYQSIITIALIAAMLIPYSYLNSFRLIFHTTYSVLFPVLVLMIFGLVDDNVFVAKKFVKLNKTAVAVFALVLVATSVYTGSLVFRDNTYAYERQSNIQMEEYIHDNPEKTFIINQVRLQPGYYNALVLPREKKNLIDFGLWLKKAKYYKNGYKANGIKHLFNDMIDNEVYIVLNEGYISDDASKRLLSEEYLLIYYKNHYRENGRTVEIKRAKQIGTYSLYKVTSRKMNLHTVRD